MIQLMKENESLSSKIAHIEAASLGDKVEKIDGISLLSTEVQAKDMEQLRSMVDEIKDQVPKGIIVLIAQNGGKVQIVASVTESLIKQGFHAGKLIKEVASICGGGGGGRPTMAQAGGKDPSKINEALTFPRKYVEQTLNQ